MMNGVSLPGFSAASSLYGRCTFYQMATRPDGPNATAVLPQLPRIFRCALASAAAAATCQIAPGSFACAAAVSRAGAICSD